MQSGTRARNHQRYRHRRGVQCNISGPASLLAARCLDCPASICAALSCLTSLCTCNVPGRIVFCRVPRLDVDLARFFFQQIILTVKYCHEKGIIIRDLKPANLLVTWGPNGPSRLQLCDFGWAKIIPDLVRSFLESARSCTSCFVPLHAKVRATHAMFSWPACTRVPA